MAYDYQKTKSWLPFEADGIIYTVNTPYGTIASTICFDMDFPGFTRQAALKGTDIMLIPGYDSAKIRPFHTELALIRGIEGGFSVVRQVNAGTSMATDYRGNIIARQDYFEVDEWTMYADVPTSGRRTVYQGLGDWFAWLSIAGIILIVVISIAKGSGVTTSRNADQQTGRQPKTA